MLVGHSYGGMVITGVAEQMHERIAAIVYLDAFMPGDRQALADFSSRTSWPEPVTPAPPVSAFHVNDKDAAWVQWETDGASDEVLHAEAEGDGSVSVDCEEALCARAAVCDEAFDQALERCRADSAWQTATVTCGHDVMIDQPAELTSMLEKFA